MSGIRTAAAREEEMELNALRAQADRTTAEAAQVLAELTRRLTVARRPGESARRLTADARAAAVRALREGPGEMAGQLGAWRPALAAIPVLAVAVALAYAVAQGKIKFSGPERTRDSVRLSYSPSQRRTSTGGTRLV